MDFFETVAEIAGRSCYGEAVAEIARRSYSREKPETNDREVIRDLVDKANQNYIQPEKIQLDVQKKNEVIEKIEELCQENIWL